jgi:hypothetical protein
MGVKLKTRNGLSAEFYHSELTYHEEPIVVDQIKDGDTVVMLADGSRGIAHVRGNDTFKGRTGVRVAYLKAKRVQLRRIVRFVSKYLANIEKELAQLCHDASAAEEPKEDTNGELFE